jgi:hypothetical protein
MRADEAAPIRHIGHDRFRYASLIKILCSFLSETPESRCYRWLPE